MKIVFIVFFVVILGVFVSPSVVYGSTIQELLQQIATIQAQIEKLKAQLAVLQPSIPSTFSFQKNLSRTNLNEEVVQLQRILQKEGLFCKTCSITGYWGYWTQVGLMNFQQKYGLRITGIVDELTRTKLNQIVQATSPPKPSTPTPTPLPTPTPAPTPTQTPTSYTTPINRSIPILFQVAAAPGTTNDNTPNYTFSSTEYGTITHGGNCSSLTTSAIAGNNTITLNTLSDGTYSNCTIRVKNSAGNESAYLSVDPFVIDTTSPTVTVTYNNINGMAKSGDSLLITATFNESMARSPAPAITIAGANTLVTTTIPRIDATHYTYTLDVGSGNGMATITIANGKDISGNTQISNSSKTFTVDNTAPVRSNGSPITPLTAETTQTIISFNTNESATCKYGISSATYTNLPSTFSTTNGTTHSQLITGLTSGASRNYFIRCSDIAGNVSSDDFNIAVSVAAPAPTPVPILVLQYFPLQTGTQNLDTVVTGMNDSLTSIRSKVDSLTQQGIDKMEMGSTYHGYKDVSAAKSLDYFVLDTKEFLSAMPVSNNQIPWNPSVFRPDYMKMLNDVNICDYVNNQGVKHVWVWGYHFGNIEPAESNMAMGTASQAFWNHGAYGDVSNSEQINDMPTCSKTYTLYNYNYGRGLGELLEDHGHQLESIYSFVDNSLWSKFRDPYGEPPPVVNSCGWTHSGPNSKAEYQPGWASEATVKSNCEDWHPDGSGVIKDVSCHTWYGVTCLDNGGVELKVWWMQNMPGRNNNLMYGTKTLRNWWDFYGDFDSALQQGKNLSF